MSNATAGPITALVLAEITEVAAGVGRQHVDLTAPEDTEALLERYQTDPNAMAAVLGGPR